MTEFEIKIENKEADKCLRKVKTNLHKEEKFRIEFQGILSKEEEYSIIYVSLPGDLKFRSNADINLLDLTLEICELRTLPDWETIHPNKEIISVKFEAEIIRMKGSIITVLLPDLYEEDPRMKPLKSIHLPESYISPFKNFVAIDFETIHAIAIDGKEYPYLPISIGMVKVRGGDIMERFYTLINPQTKGEWLGYIKPTIKAIECFNAPNYNEIYPIVEYFVGSFQPVAFSCGICKNVFKNIENIYNIKHSFTHRKNEKQRIHTEEFIDPLIILQAFGEKKNNLVKACERRNIYTYGAHNALSDAESIAKLLIELEHEKRKFEIIKNKEG